MILLASFLEEQGSSSAVEDMGREVGGKKLPKNKRCGSEEKSFFPPLSSDLTVYIYKYIQSRNKASLVSVDWSFHCLHSCVSNHTHKRKSPTDLLFKKKRIRMAISCTNTVAYIPYFDFPHDLLTRMLIEWTWKNRIEKDIRSLSEKWIRGFIWKIKAFTFSRLTQSGHEISCVCVKVLALRGENKKKGKREREIRRLYYLDEILPWFLP